MERWPVAILIAACLLAAAQPAAAWLGTDESGDYAYSDSQSTGDADHPTHSFSSIASSGEAGPTGDSAAESAAIGFDFELYGEVYNQVFINTNGFIGFGESCTYCSTGTIPSTTTPNGYIAGLHADLHTREGGIYFETQGAPGSRRFVVEFSEVEYYYAYGDATATFQIVLYEGSDDIAVVIESDGDMDSSSLTIGIENHDGTDGIEYHRGATSSVDLDGVTILFSPQREAPRVNVLTDPLEVDEGGSIDIEVATTDRQGDTVTVEWDLDADGDYSDATAETITFSAEGLDGPSTVPLSVRASDPSGNTMDRELTVRVLNAPPVLSGPPEQTDLFIGQEWTYSPEITDPGGDEVTFQVVGRPTAMVLMSGGGVRWTPTELDVGEHVLTYVATDDDDDPTVEGDGDARFEIVLTVAENQPPGAIRIISPDRDEEVAEIRPTIVVENATDPEGDALRIMFEVDERDTFPDPLVTGNAQAGFDGTTSWTVPVDLVPGTRYYVRAWANDGAADGPRASRSFRVGGGAEGDGGTDGGGGEEPTPGCACRAADQPGGVPEILVAAILLTAAIRLFRR